MWVGKAFGFVILQKKGLSEEDKTCQPPEKYKMRCKWYIMWGECGGKPLKCLMRENKNMKCFALFL